MRRLAVADGGQSIGKAGAPDLTETATDKCHRSSLRRSGRCCRPQLATGANSDWNSIRRALLRSASRCTDAARSGRRLTASTPLSISAWFPVPPERKVNKTELGQRRAAHEQALPLGTQGRAGTSQFDQ